MARRVTDERQQRMPGLRPEVAVAAGTVITRGATLEGTSMHAMLQDGYRVTAGIEVENWTRFPLLDPTAKVKGGVLTVAPYSVMPASRQAMIGRKTYGTPTGSYGTVSWLIGDLQRRLVILWSAPFNFNHFSNWLAVGIAQTKDHPEDDSWFDQMYYRESSVSLNFQRKEFDSDVRPLVFRDQDFEVEGIMCSDHKALAKVIFKPHSEEDLAQTIRDKLLA